MLSKCKDLQRITSSRLFQHACCYSLGRPKKNKKNGKRLWLTKYINVKIYNTAHLAKQWQRWIQGVTKGCFEQCLWKNNTDFMWCHLFFMNSLLPKLSALFTKSQKHMLCLNCWPANKGLCCGSSYQLLSSFMRGPSDVINHIWVSLCKTIPPLLWRWTTVWLSCQNTTSAEV